MRHLLFSLLLLFAAVRPTTITALPATASSATSVSTDDDDASLWTYHLAYHEAQQAVCAGSVCVGCGRCVNKCPQHLNIVKVIKKIGGENK